MKVLLSSNVCLGALPAENMDVERTEKWQKNRIEHLKDLIDKAAQNNAKYIALFGRVFGAERVSESVIDSLFGAISSDKHIQTFLFLNAEEYRRISYRKDIPNNLHLLCPAIEDSYIYEDISVSTHSEIIKFNLLNGKSVFVKKYHDGSFSVDVSEKEKILPSFEPIGFEDAVKSGFGYGVVECDNTSEIKYSEINDKMYSFHTVEVKILPEDNKKDILDKIYKAISRVDYKTFLRLTMTGKTAFAITINADALRNELHKKVFFADVFDNTSMDIDVDEFENDISLRSEFVRLTLNDDSLSELERGRIISCGWNALTGKEVLDE